MVRRITSAMFLGICAVLLIATVAIAAYTAVIQVSETLGNDYAMYPFRVSLDVDYLASNSFFNSSEGLDTRVGTAASDYPHMLAEDKLLFASALAAHGSLPLEFTTHNTLLAAFNVILGDGGYFKVEDTDHLEPGDNYSTEIVRYLDDPETILDKPGVYNISRGTDNVDVQLPIGGATFTQVVENNQTKLASDQNHRAGERFYNFPATQGIYQVDLSLYKNNNPVGTAYVRVRDAVTDHILGTIGSIDVSTLGAASAVYSFSTNSVIMTDNNSVRIAIEYAGSGGGDYIQVDYQNTNVYADGNMTLYNGATWINHNTYDCYFKVYYRDSSPELAATSVADGAPIIRIWADGTYAHLSINGTEADNISIGAGLPNNSENWTITPGGYMEYLKHSVGGLLRAQYQPDTIIEGTTLPDEAGGDEPGVITWGENAEGVSVIMNSLIPSGGATANVSILAPPVAVPELNMPENMFDPGPGGDLGTVLDPLVEIVADTGTPYRLIWYFLATLVVLGGIGFTYKHLPNLWIAAGVGVVLIGVMWGMTVLPYWLVIVAVVAVFGALIIDQKAGL